MPDQGLTPPGPPVEPEPTPPAPPVGPYGPPFANPYTVPMAGHGTTARADRGLGWTGFGLAMAFCLPCLPLAGVVIAIITLARRKFEPRWLAVLALVLGLAFTAVQAALAPGMIEDFGEGFRDGMQEGMENPDGDDDTIPTTMLRTGDCFNDDVLKGLEELDMAEAQEVEIVPCNEPHDFEVYATIDIKAKRFPGNEKIEQRVSACTPAFRKFVGIPYQDSRYEMYQYLPTRKSWTYADDRSISCIIAHPKLKKLNRSLRNVRR